mmetsp:Transcript_13076/g.31993  ORF Transcript_13076/g.31993 Transcript_13076/m.31993 type:complete len:107 (+) Transcript_13076:148-468(+)
MMQWGASASSTSLTLEPSPPNENLKLKHSWNAVSAAARTWTARSFQIAAQTATTYFDTTPQLPSMWDLGHTATWVVGMRMAGVQQALGPLGEPPAPALQGQPPAGL